MEFKYFSILISFLLGLLVIRYIRKFDVYEKEPFLAMILITLLGGAASIFLAKFIYQLLPILGIQYKSYFTFWGMFVFVGPIEEFSKFIGLLICYPFLEKKLNEMNDGIIYMSCIALGFSLIENYQYANSAPGQEYLILLRLFISTPMHIAFSSFIGLSFYKVFVEKKNGSLLFYAFVWASLLHGLFDGVLTLQVLYFMVFFVIFIIISQNLILLRMTNMLSPFRVKFTDAFKEVSVDSETKTSCPKCKTTGVNRKLAFRNMVFFRCSNCNSSFASRKTIYDIFRHFAPSFKNVKRQVYRIEKEGGELFTLKNSIFFENKKHGNGYFNESDIVDYFDAHKMRVTEQFQTSIISPAKYIAFK